MKTRRLPLMIRYLSLIVFVIFSAGANATWQCPAIDKYGQFYAVNSNFIKVTVYKSLDRCKKFSSAPASCIVERAFCKQFGISDTRKTHWQCYALDNADGKYRSGPYSDRYEAANAAESLCQRLSKSPSSCYVHLFTCENI